jgi:hypothetical protein
VDKANVVWYLPGPDQKPRGPYTAEQVVAAVRAGQIHAGTLCWREGMPQWLPVGQIGELALSLASVQPRAPVVPPATSPAMPSVVVGSESPAQQRSVVGRLVSWGVLIAVLGAAGTVGYIWFQESSAIRKAERLIAAGEFKEAVRLMKSLEPDAYVFGKKAEYLGSVASVKEFASSAEKADAEDLKRPKSHLEKLFAADESWRSLGSTDLADLLRLVPRSAPDAVSRGAALADLLQELGLAQAKPLAKDLLALAKEVAEKNSENTAGWMDVAMATSILGRDDSLGGELLALILPGSEEKRQQFEQGAAAIRRWVGVQASLAKPLAAAVVQRIDALAQSGDNERCQRLLVLAQQLTADPQKKASLATKFLQIAGNLQPKDPEAARRAMAEAIRLDPSTDKNPKTASLWLQLHPNPTEEKLARYRSLLGPGDAVDPLVGVTLLADATTFGALRSNLADSYRTAALAAAKELLAKPSDAQDLDPRGCVWRIAAQCPTKQRGDRPARSPTESGARQQAQSGDCHEDRAVEAAKRKNGHHRGRRFGKIRRRQPEGDAAQRTGSHPHHHGEPDRAASYPGGRGMHRRQVPVRRGCIAPQVGQRRRDPLGKQRRADIF